eukprot:766991-Hanusia_phi.AAC.21
MSRVCCCNNTDKSRRASQNRFLHLQPAAWSCGLPGYRKQRGFSRLRVLEVELGKERAGGDGSRQRKV